MSKKRISEKIKKYLFIAKLLSGNQKGMIESIEKLYSLHLQSIKEFEDFQSNIAEMSEKEAEVKYNDLINKWCK